MLTNIKAIANVDNLACLISSLVVVIISLVCILIGYHVYKNHRSLNSKIFDLITALVVGIVICPLLWITVNDYTNNINFAKLNSPSALVSNDFVTNTFEHKTNQFNKKYHRMNYSKYLSKDSIPTVIKEIKRNKATLPAEEENSQLLSAGSVQYTVAEQQIQVQKLFDTNNQRVLNYLKTSHNHLIQKPRLYNYF